MEAFLYPQGNDDDVFLTYTDNAALPAWIKELDMLIKPRIFVIAADWSLRTVLTEALKDEGYVVESTHDGETLFSCGEIVEFPYDLMIINMTTPDNKHCQWLYDLHRRFPHLPIIVISDFRSEPEMRNSLMECGITDLFSKLFNLNDVLTCVERILNRTKKEGLLLA